MITETSFHSMDASKDQPQSDRRKTIRRKEDKLREQAHHERARKLHSLLELGQIVGLDLQLNDMLLEIAGKACEVMEADRCSVFLHDSVRDELWSTVAMGMGGEVIRIPSRIGLAGACFQTGKTIEMKARAYLPKEKLGEIVPFLEDVLTYEYLPGWKRLLMKLEGFFNARWGDYWQKSEAKFWKEFDEKTAHTK